MTNDPRVDVVFDEAMRGLHPTDGPLNVAVTRLAALERKVAYLEQRVAVLVRLVDLLAERDGA